MLLCEWTQSLVLTAQRVIDIVPIFRDVRPWIFSGASYPGPLGSARLGIMEPLSSPGVPGDSGPGNTSLMGTLSASHSLLTSSMGSLSAPGVQTLLSCLVLFLATGWGLPRCLVFFHLLAFVQAASSARCSLFLACFPTRESNQIHRSLVRLAPLSCPLTSSETTLSVYIRVLLAGP